MNLLMFHYYFVCMYSIAYAVLLYLIDQFNFNSRAHLSPSVVFSLVHRLSLSLSRHEVPRVVC